MGIAFKPLLTPSGLQLYPDDLNRLRYYVMPTGLDVAVDGNGGYRFSLLFYQTDFPERGARLVMALSPTYPQPDPDDVKAVIGAEAKVVGVPFDRGEIQLIWPTVTTPPEAVQVVSGGLIQIETSLSQMQASGLRQLFAAGCENVRVAARLVYTQMTEPLSVTAQIRLRPVAEFLRLQRDDKVVNGRDFCALVTELPSSAVTLTARGELAALPTAELRSRCTPALAPLIATATSDLVGDGLIFDEKNFRLRQIDQVEDAEVRLDLSRSRPWSSIWSGEWSLSDFRRRVEAAGQLATYFPEVLHVPAVGYARVLVESLLPLTVDTVRLVNVQLKHRKLGSLEEKQIQLRFTPQSAPVAAVGNIPVIAYTPLEYRYAIQLELSPASPGDIPEIIPTHPPWQPSGQPLVEVGTAYLPYACAFARAEAGVFDYIGRADIEFAAPGDELPQVLARITLTAARSSRWLLIRSLPFSTQAIRWRPLLYPDPDGADEPIVRPWRTETNLQAMLNIWDVYPRDPVKVRVTVHKGDTPEIHLIKIQLCSGSHIEEGIKPEVEHLFSGDDTRTFTLWPKTIFDPGFVYRVIVSLASGKELPGSWQLGQGDSIDMNVEKDFYFTRQVEVTMKGPWSAQHSPDPSSRKGEIIYAEVFLQLTGTTDTQSRSFTFDSDNQGESFKWTVRGPRGAERYVYQVQMLSLDGQVHQFGPYQNDREKLALEIVRTLVSDIEPPKFEVRETAP